MIEIPLIECPKCNVPVILTHFDTGAVRVLCPVCKQKGFFVELSHGDILRLDSYDEHTGMRNESE